MTMLRLPSSAMYSFASKTVARIKSRGSRSRREGFPPQSPSCSHNATVHRKSMVLEHRDGKHLEDTYDVVVGRQLGAGGFGTVSRASLKGAETVARAVKTIKKDDSKGEEFVRREIAIMTHLDHPCICRLLETFEDEWQIHLVLEFIDGRELFDEIVEQRSLDEKRVAAIMQQVFGALQYCHEQKVIHRDLKPENIMVLHASREGKKSKESKRIPEVKLIDFGMAMMYDSDYVMGTAVSSIMGSEDYMAPEALQGRCFPASDVWSAGIVLHALLVGSLPNGELPIAEGGAWEHVSPGAKEMVQGLLVVDPSRRLSAPEAAGHAWTRGVASVPLLIGQVNNMMENFMSFHRSVKLRRAALTALAMQLTNQQLADHREQFIAIDADGNGRISKQELTDSILATSPLCHQEIRSWVETVFDSIDTDGSQEIDYTEWLAAAAYEGAHRSEQTMRAAFRVFDTDGDGKIDEGEFARVLRQTPHEVAALLPQFDANGDGSIDFEEFQNLLNSGAPMTFSV